MVKILIVDDEEIIRKMIKRVLSQKHSVPLEDIAEAEDGAKALDILKNNSIIDLMITDTEMPVLNGYQLIKKSREEIGYHGRIIQTTGNPEKNKKADYANYYLLKPFDLDDFNKIISNYLSKED